MQLIARSVEGAKGIARAKTGGRKVLPLGQYNWEASVVNAQWRRKRLDVIRSRRGRERKQFMDCPIGRPLALL